MTQLRARPHGQSIGKTAIWSALMALSMGGAMAQTQTDYDLFVNHRAGMADYFASDAEGSSVSGPAGAVFIYQARVGINGAAAQSVSNISLTQQLPNGAVFQGIDTPTGTTCANQPVPGTVIDANNARITCTIPSVTGGGAQGGYADVNFRVILPSVDSEWRAFASATSTSNNDSDAANNNELERRVTTYEAADLQLQFTAPTAGSELIDGAPFTYQLQVTNKAGPYGKDLVVGDRVVVRFEQPEGAQFGSAPTGTNWQCSRANTIWSCTFTASSVFAKGMDLPTLSVPANAQRVGNISALASVSSLDNAGQAVRDVQPDDNTSTIAIRVASDNVINVNLNKTANLPVLDQLGGAQDITYSITPRWVSGTDKPGNLRVTDTMPEGVTINTDALRTSNAVWNCDLSTSTVLNCSFALESAGYPSSKNSNFPSIRIPATASRSTVEAGGTIVNTASVTADREDPSQGADNNASATVAISNTMDVSLTKTPMASGGASLGVLKNGSIYAYRIRITNNGPLDIRAGQTLSISDKLHPNLRLVAATDSNAYPASPTSTPWTCSDAPAGGAPTITGTAGALVNCSYTARAATKARQAIDLFLWVEVVGLSSNATAQISNSATLTGITGRDPLPTTIIANAVSVNASDKSADLQITKTATPGAIFDVQSPAKSGDLVTYILTVTNPGDEQNQPAKTVQVRDQIRNLITRTYAAAPFNITPITNTANGSNLYWYHDYLTVRVTGTENSQDTCTLGSYNGTQLAADLLCTFNDMPVNASYTITVQAKQFVDPYTGNAPHPETGITANGTAGVLSNTANVSSPDTNDSNTDNNSATVYVAMQALTDLALTRQASPLNDANEAQAAAGGAINYTLTVENKGPSAAANVYVEDLLPLGAYWIGQAATASNNGQCGYRAAGNDALQPFKDGDWITEANQTLVCEWMGNFAKGQQSINYKLRSEQLGQVRLDSTAEVFTLTPEVQSDNNTAQQAVLLTEPQVDVEVEMRHTADGIPLGNDTVYTITVTNIAGSNSYARNVVMHNAFHSPLFDSAGNPIADSNAFFTFDEIIDLSSTGRDTGAASFTANNCSVDQTAKQGGLTCTFPWMAPGESVDISFRMKADSLSEGKPVGTIFHSAEVSADLEQFDYGSTYTPLNSTPKVLLNNTTQDRTSTYDPAQIDPDAPNPSLWADLEVQQSVLTITHEDPDATINDPVTAGSTVQYQLLVRNAETNAAFIATDVVVRNELPIGVTLVENSLPANCSYAADSRTLSCTIGVLAAEQTSDIQFSVLLDTPYNGTGESLRNCAAVASATVDPVDGNNTACTEVPSKRTIPSAPVSVPSLHTGAVLLLAIFMMALAWRTRRHNK